MKQLATLDEGGQELRRAGQDKGYEMALNQTVLHRRGFIGGFAAAVAALAAPASFAKSIAFDSSVTHAIEIVQEGVIEDPMSFYLLYRCLARCGDDYAYGTCQVFSAETWARLEIKDSVRKAAKHACREYFDRKNMK